MEDEPEQESDRRRMYFLVLLPPLPRPAEDFVGRRSSSCEMHVNEFPIFF